MADQGFLAHQRRAVILDLVHRGGGVRVADLVEQLGVSDMTVRRDLDTLARTGAVEKVHGGALVPVAGRALDEPGFEAKSGRESGAKAAIADAAALLVQPGSVVGLSAGTTAFAVATRLLDRPDLTVVTNSLPVAGLLRAADREQAHVSPAVLVTGGAPTRSAALAGPLANLTIESLHVDLLIIGAHGVSERAGLTTPDLAEAQTNRALLACARRVAVVADHTKWGVVGLNGFAELGAVHHFVTDDRLDSHARSVLADRVGELILAREPSGGHDPA
ncbi:DeoR family transcriptional regulator [Kitasatospora herbaricolor]|uniref:DeoR/GlpR family DNA-binding transcription regulator n=1 Tax=Kitasatospora herbaricolor TaxID=68217 RepID=UPI001748643C|nr:DeoR/GlpR family DNA-binding transcription regulator [Kitasatospora herbaricolor]MDQ0312416.1 DeoR/GlpR family transcriptional regulator of sugar metabolism [Kitasatospora herbaricolor]GGV40621.1 DeoR family transcriptional regulator [Kitasatospora herbaricolor]